MCSNKDPTQPKKKKKVIVQIHQTKLKGNLVSWMTGKKKLSELQYRETNRWKIYERLRDTENRVRRTKSRIEAKCEEIMPESVTKLMTDTNPYIQEP